MHITTQQPAITSETLPRGVVLQVRKPVGIGFADVPFDWYAGDHQLSAGATLFSYIIPEHERFSAEYTAERIAKTGYLLPPVAQWKAEQSEQGLRKAIALEPAAAPGCDHEALARPIRHPCDRQCNPPSASVPRRR